MNVEDLRDYCLSLGNDVEEKMPFQAFKAANGVLAFYVCGHMFCYFDVDHFSVATVKCQPERIPVLLEEKEGVVPPYNMIQKHWIGLQPDVADEALVRELVRNSYALVKAKYARKRT